MKEWFANRAPLLIKAGWTVFAVMVGGVFSFSVRVWHAKDTTDAYIDHRASLIYEAKSAPVYAQRTEQFNTIDHRLSNLERGQIDNAMALGRIEGRMEAFIQAARKR